MQYNLCKAVHCALAGKCNFEGGDKLCKHEPEKVLENEDYKILQDFIIQTGHVIEAQRSDCWQLIRNTELVKLLFLEVIGLKRRIEREDRKVSRSKKGVTEYLECESQGYTISCGFFKCYTETVRQQIERDWYHSKKQDKFRRQFYQERLEY